MIYSSQNFGAKKTSVGYWVLGMFNSQMVYGAETEPVAPVSGAAIFGLDKNRFYRMRRTGVK